MTPSTSRPRIRAVTFDVGGTLIEPHPSVGHIYREVAIQHGCRSLDAEALDRSFREAWKNRRNFNHSYADWSAIVDRTFAGFVDKSPSRTFFPEIYRRFADKEAWRLREDVLPALNELASEGFALAVVSNWDERLRPLLAKLELEGYFDAIIVSCEVGFSKPSGVIFEHAASKLGRPPGSILHVGDSRTEDYEGAIAAGFKALHLDRKSRSTENTIKTLLEVLERARDFE